MCVTPSACLLLLQCSKCAPDRLNQAIESGAEEKEAKLQADRERREDLCKQLRGLFKAIDQDGSGTLTLDELLAGDLSIRNTLAEVPLRFVYRDSSQLPDSVIDGVLCYSGFGRYLSIHSLDGTWCEPTKCFAYCSNPIEFRDSFLAIIIRFQSRFRIHGALPDFSMRKDLPPFCHENKIA